MNKFQNSKEFGEVVKHLNNKSFDKALKIINSIAHKYQDDQIILKMFASIYFNKLEWEKAITYYKKILTFEKHKFKILLNIGVALYKLGKINKSIEAFKDAIDDNPNFDITHDNLGISYLEIAKFDEAIKCFSLALKINKNNLNAQRHLINILSLAKPKKNNNNSIIKLDKKISNLTKDLKIKNLVDEENIRIILDKSINLINKYEEDIIFNETQLFKKNSKNLNCQRHFKVFNKFNIIPKFCFSCYKIQVNTINVVDLIKLSFLFKNLELKNNNTRKCIVEIRNQVSGNYKGFIYCEGIEDAKNIFELVKKETKQANLNSLNINIKHGCSEFYKPYPKFEKLNFNKKEEMTYNEKWKAKEELIDNEEPSRIKIDKKVWAATLKEVSLSDILIINNWLNYADFIGDFSYKKIFSEKIHSAYMEKILTDQIEFRKKNLVI